MPCQARAESDQYRCALCRIVWDRNDPNPPKCPQEEFDKGKLIGKAIGWDTAKRDTSNLLSKLSDK